MIAELHLQNFRGFDDHKIPFHPQTTIVVGKNNAGKSTIVEALRLIGVITNRYQRLEFKAVPDWLDRPLREKGVSPSLAGMELDLYSAFHRYNDPPAIITCTFSDGASITVYVGSKGQTHGVIRDSRKNVIASQAKARSIEMPKVQILPQIAPLEEKELILGEEYVRRHILTSRSL